ncbi:MAG: hypothetical protein ABI253_06495 [Mycobacterium sp.]
MYLYIRPCVAAAAALAAGSLIAVAPVTPNLPGVQVPDIQLTADDDAVGQAFAELLLQQLRSSTTLIQNVQTFDAAIVAAEHPSYLSWLLPGSADNAPLANDAVAHLFNSFNQLFGSHQAAFVGGFGARGILDATDNYGSFYPFDPAVFYSSLNIGTNPDVIPGAAAVEAFGGLEGAIGQYTVFGSAVAKLMGGDFASQADFDSLASHVGALNDAIFAAEHNFNTALGSAEVALEQALFGTDSAYNGVINRFIDSFNMMYDIHEQHVNGLLGLDALPLDLTHSLLVTPEGFRGPIELLNDGSIGGLTGMFYQNLLVLLDGLGVDGSNSGIPDGWVFGSGDVAGAWQELMTVVNGGPFADVFDLSQGGDVSNIFTDLTNIWNDILGLG